MTLAIAKTCLEQGVAVTCDGRRYHRINAIILRKHHANQRDEKKPPKLYVEMYDGFSNSVLVVPIEDVDLIAPANAEART